MCIRDRITNRKRKEGKLAEVLKDADIFIGVSTGNVVTKEMVERMSENAIVFALANPVPEIMPEEAKKGGAKIVATGRSDFPNQINNLLCFPGIFRGALDANAREINEEMKIAASNTLAELVEEPDETTVLPSPLSKDVVKRVAESVRKAAFKSGAAKRK